jgi:DNA-binding MarR family transcriptional regulator/predicted N-acetyltransferase YhbS
MADPVPAVRGFNRFYTQKIGVLEEGHLESAFSLTEVRVLYELSHRDATSASEIGRELGLDAGYLSRIVRSFEQRGLIEKERSDEDARRTLLRLSKEGRATFKKLDKRADAQVAAMLARLSDSERLRLMGSMKTIRALLGDDEAPAAPYVLRQHRVGDMGWVVHRHAVLYSEEYGWNERFESLVVRIVADFIDHYDPSRERCWIAERDAEILGSVFLVKKSKTIAKLRLLLVEPSARGLGLGTRLVDECIRFAKQCGYKTLTLWTNSVLHSARRIYEARGFQLTGEERNTMFGPELVAQNWDLDLTQR